jgi:hypothetical protein
VGHRCGQSATTDKTTIEVLCGSGLPIGGPDTAAPDGVAYAVGITPRGVLEAVTYYHHYPALAASQTLLQTRSFPSTSEKYTLVGLLPSSQGSQDRRWGQAATPGSVDDFDRTVSDGASAALKPDC